MCLPHLAAESCSSCLLQVLVIFLVGGTQITTHSPCLTPATLNRTQCHGDSSRAFVPRAVEVADLNLDAYGITSTLGLGCPAAHYFCGKTFHQELELVSLLRVLPWPRFTRLSVGVDPDVCAGQDSSGDVKDSQGWGPASTRTTGFHTRQHPASPEGDKGFRGPASRGPDLAGVDHTPVAITVPMSSILSDSEVPRPPMVRYFLGLKAYLGFCMCFPYLDFFSLLRPRSSLCRSTCCF